MALTYLITGAAGFIGSHLARALLESGGRVVGVDNFDPFYAEALKRANLAGLPKGDFRLLEMDIRNASLRERMREVKPDVVVHLAALAGVRPSIEAPARYVSVNLDGLTNVLEAVRTSGCRRVLFASSSSVYGNKSKVPFAETDAVDEPISPYAATKRAGELLCHTYGQLFGLTIASLRLFTVFGPCQRPDLAIARFMRALQRGEEIPMFGDGSTSRDYTYVDDMVAGIRAAEAWTASQQRGVCRIFNLGGSHTVTLKALIKAIGKVTGHQARIRALPRQQGDVTRTFADLTRSRSELGYEPATPFEEGLRRQWQWAQSQMGREHCTQNL